MADHDLAAELRGYRNELDFAHKHRPDRAAAIRAEIDRVREVIRSQAAAIDGRAAALEEAGQDVAAAELHVAARQLRDLLDDQADEADVEGADETPRTAADSTPRQRAVPRKGK